MWHRSQQSKSPNHNVQTCWWGIRDHLLDRISHPSSLHVYIPYTAEQVPSPEGFFRAFSYKTTMMYAWTRGWNRYYWTWGSWFYRQTREIKGNNVKQLKLKNSKIFKKKSYIFFFMSLFLKRRWGNFFRRLPSSASACALNSVNHRSTASGITLSSFSS